MQKHKKIDFLAEYNKRPTPERRRGQRTQLALPLLVVGLLFVCAAAYMGVRIFLLSRSLKTEQEYINDAAVQQQYAQAQQTNEEVNYLSSFESEISAARAELSAQVDVGSGLFNSVLNCCGEYITVQSWTYSDDGVLSLAISSLTVTEIPSFVARLQATEKFDSVTYSGYQTTDGGASYTVTVFAAPAAPQTESEAAE